MGAGGMTTVWRPRVRIPVPKVDDEVEVGVEVPEEVLLTVKGTKRKRAPPTKGAMRARGEVSLELQGVQCLSARSSAPSMQGVRWVTNLRARSSAQSVQGVRWVTNLRARSSRSNARSAVVHQSASTVVSALDARSAVGLQSASTVVSAMVQGVRGVHTASTVVSADARMRWAQLRARS